MKNKSMDVVFILDMSGSMQGTETDTIGGYNGYIAKQKKKNIEVTTVLFNDRYNMIVKEKEISKVKKLTNKDYFPTGCTALLDAIGKTIKYFENNNSKKVLFMITTDGYENASHEFSKSQIKEMIESHKEWEFIYTGADIDSYQEGTGIGIRSNNIANYEKSSKGIKKLFNCFLDVSDDYEKNDCINESWKENLDDKSKKTKKKLKKYIDKNDQNFLNF